MAQPTPYPEVNAILLDLLSSVVSILDSQFVGMYLDGSLAAGDFDRDSDVDFVVVTNDEVTADLFLELRAMHDRIATLDYWCATQLEGSYISGLALRRHDPALTSHPNIERGTGERLKMTEHDEAWIVHRYILRESGIALAGPAAHTLIDPVSPDDLRKAMLANIHWAASILNDAGHISNRGYQSYVVLSLCRILYTLRYGAVVSKPVAARWAQEALGGQWVRLIESAWEGRHNPAGEASAEDVGKTLELIRHTLDVSKQFPCTSETPADPK